MTLSTLDPTNPTVHDPLPSIDESINAFRAFLVRADTSENTKNGISPKLELKSLQSTIREGANCVLASFSDSTSYRSREATKGITGVEKSWIVDKYPLFTEVSMDGACIDSRAKGEADMTKNTWEAILVKIFQEAYGAYAVAITADNRGSEMSQLPGRALGIVCSAFGQSGSKGSGPGRSVDWTIHRHTADTASETEIVATYVIEGGRDCEDKKSMGMDIMFKMADGK